jgi:PKD repeat protein
VHSRHRHTTESLTHALRLAGLVSLLGLITCSGPTEPAITRLEVADSPTADATDAGEVMIGAGDNGSCSSSSRDEQVANVIDSLVGVHPGAVVFPVGDVVYDKGTAAEFQNCYQPSWGRHKARSRPAVGNHEYETPNAKGYFDYFNGVGVANGPAGDRTKGYYSYDLGKWHIVVLNSNNSFVPSTGGTAQDNWLKADLAATSQPCIMAYWHHARFASSRTSPLPSPPSYTKAFWNALYNAGADLVVVAHQHFYERFAPQDPNGNADPVNGIRQFVVGTGGRSVTPMTVIRQNSQVMNGSTFGVLKLTLRNGSYDWEFIPIAGRTFRDSGTGNCKGSPIPDPNEPPTASFTHSCNGLTCDFHGTSSDPDGTIVSRLWEFGDGQTSTASPASHTYTAGGSYTVRLTVTDNDGATGTTTQTVNVSAPNQPPTASFTHSCDGLACTFTDGSTDNGSITAWSWNFGDGNSSNQQNPTHTYAAGGSYTVQLTVTDNQGVTGTVSHAVDVTAPGPPPNQPPSAGFSHSCDVLACSFTDTSTDPNGSGTITAWSWTFGDGSTSNQQNPSHTYTEGGTYTVELTVTDDQGASNSKQRTVDLTAGAPGPNQPPSADFTQDCTGLACDFTDRSTDDGTIEGWSWDFGDGTTSNQQNPSRTYTAGGSYSVRLTVTDDNGATNAITRTVTVSAPNSPPTAGFTQTCTGLSCSFTDGSTDTGGSITAWSWNFGDGSTSNQQNPSRTYTAAGTYTVTLTVTDNGGATASTSRSVTVTGPAPGPNQNPTANFNRSCTGASCVFTDTSTDPDGTIAAWSWQFGDGNTSNQRHPTHTYARGGTYTIRLTVTDNRQGTGTVSKTETIITITATGRIANGARVVDLTWIGAKGTNVDIRRNGTKIVTTPNDGAHTDPVGGSGSVTHQYRVCNAGSTTVCSAVANVQF